MRIAKALYDIVNPSANAWIRFHYDSTTGERGIQMKITNKTGESSVKGKVVCPSATIDKAVQLVQISEDGLDPIGVIYEAGIADGSDMWIWLNGSLCQVLFIDDNSNAESIPTREYIAICCNQAGTTHANGRVYNIAVPTATPASPEHFAECGHIFETKAAGTNVLALCLIHFN